MDVLVLNKIAGYENGIDEIIKALKHTKNIRDILHFEGFTNRRIAEIENIDEYTVSIYIKNYKSKRLDGLNNCRGGGASKKIDEEQEKFKNDFEF